jgi:hypothetical protein
LAGARVAQIFNLLYREFATRKVTEVAGATEVSTFCRLQIGDAAE